MDFDVQNHARTRALRSDSPVRSGPFVERYDPNWPSPFANYAIPDNGAAPRVLPIRSRGQAHGNG